MAPYALPLLSYHLPARNESSSHSKKRRRSPTPDDIEDDVFSPTTNSSNPLALDPHEISQYRLAGFPFHRELPTLIEPDFPHRSLTSNIILREQKVLRPTAREVRKFPLDTSDTKNYKLKHLEVLITILKRCLMRGDVERATRAWALLLRTTISGHAIEIRESGYWGIGAELLIRAGLGESTQWASEGGLRNVREYFERLILQYPYKRQYADAVNPLDFYPVMFGCEIYAIQLAHTSELKRLLSEEDEFEAGEFMQSEAPILREGETMIEAHDRIDRELRMAWRRRRRRDIRTKALNAAEQLVAKMDEVMKLPPYSDAQSLLRLRGMIVLYIGDLHVPDEHGKDEIVEDRGEYRIAQEHGLRRRRADLLDIE